MKARGTVAWMAAAVLSTGCGGGPGSVQAPLQRFNVAMCPRVAPEVSTLPADPKVEGVKASLSLVSRRVASAGFVRISLTFTNSGLHGTTLALPQQAFSLAGYDLVDHNCVPVPYRQAPTPKALAYGNTGPMPLNQGESATLDLSLDDMAPGLVLPPGTYAIRLALKIDPSSQVVRGRTVWSEWTVFVVGPPAS